MKKYRVGLSFVTLAMALLFPGLAAAPVKLSDVAAVEDLAAEGQAKLLLLAEYLKDGDSYAAAIKKKIPRAAGVLACMGQAIAEHANQSMVKVAGADLRNAAIDVVKSKTYTEAVAALEVAKQAAVGKSAGGAKTEHAWDQLIDLHAMMKEVNARNSKLRRAIRRPKDPKTESLHATTLAVLALAIHANTHRLKNKADIPQWQRYAADLQTNMTALAAALKKQDQAAAKQWYVKGVKSCSSCHKAFRKKKKD